MTINKSQNKNPHSCSDERNVKADCLRSRNKVLRRYVFCYSSCMYINCVLIDWLVGGVVRKLRLLHSIASTTMMVYTRISCPFRTRRERRRRQWILLVREKTGRDAICFIILLSTLSTFLVFVTTTTTKMEIERSYLFYCPPRSALLDECRVHFWI